MKAVHILAVTSLMLASIAPVHAGAGTNGMGVNGTGTNGTGTNEIGRAHV
jgi:hypothetical protein